VSLDDLYREVILDHYSHPRNRGVADPADVTREGANPLCGDEITISLRVRGGIVEDVRFEGKGCSISQASASMMTELVKGQKLNEAESAVQRFTQGMANRQPPPQELDEELDALQGVKKYPARVKCALLPWTTLRETVDLYRHREGPAQAGHEAVLIDCADAP
jgi:nitrogen fixation NifU-like protein